MEKPVELHRLSVDLAAEHVHAVMDLIGEFAAAQNFTVDMRDTGVVRQVPKEVDPSSLAKTVVDGKTGQEVQVITNEQLDAYAATLSRNGTGNRIFIAIRRATPYSSHMSAELCASLFAGDENTFGLSLNPLKELVHGLSDGTYVIFNVDKTSIGILDTLLRTVHQQSAEQPI